MKTQAKMMMVLLLALSCPLVTWCDEGRGGQAGSFLRIPGGVRAMGMGGAYASIANDAEAMYFNPGGLYQIQASTLSGMYSFLTLERLFYQASYVGGIEDLGTIGFMMTGFGAGDIERRDTEGVLHDSYDDTEMCFAFAYSRFLGFVGFGGSLKYIQHLLADQKAEGLAFDVGFHEEFRINRGYFGAILIGASASNLGARLIWDTATEKEEDIPVTYRAGAAMRFQFANGTLLLAVDGSRVEEGETVLCAGIERTLGDSFSLRGGMEGDDWAAGAGARFGKVAFDYALTADDTDGYCSRVGIQLHLGGAAVMSE